MKIGIDLDGVLADFEHPYIQWASAITGVEIPYVKEFPEWGYVDKFLSKSQLTKVWEEIKESKDFWRTLPPHSTFNVGVASKLDELAKIHEVYYLTVRPGRNAKQQTEDWLETYGILNPTVVVCRDKGPVANGMGLECLIDDYPKNIQSVLKACGTSCRCYLRNKDYNKDFIHPYVVRVKDVKTMLDVEKL